MNKEKGNNEAFCSDPSKESQNLHKHHVEFRYVHRALQDPNKIILYDQANSGINKFGFFEKRWKAIGKAGKRTLFVSYTIRNGEPRIISARRATKAEKRRYKRRKTEHG